MPALRLDAIDLDMLASFVDSYDYNAAYLDPATGAVYAAFDGEVLGADNEPIDLETVNWIGIGGAPSHASYRDMQVFAEAVEDLHAREQLLRALEGKGAFRRFRETVYRQPEQISRAWGRYRELRAMVRAIEWLVDEKIVAEREANVRLERLEDDARQTIEDLRDPR